MTASTLSTTVSEAFSFGTVFSSIWKQNQAGTGSQSITVLGASVGHVSYSGTIRAGQTGCESTYWESDTSVRCQSGQGERGTRRVQVTSGQRAWSVSQMWSVDVGIVSVTQKQNHAGTGSASVSVHGINFGLKMNTMTTHEGSTACESTDWESETSLACLVSDAALGTRRVTVTAGGRGGSATQILSVDAGILVSARGSINFASVGSSNVTALSGLNLGTSDRTLKSRVGISAGEISMWKSDTMVVCRVPPGTKRLLSLIITAGMRDATLTSMVSYDSPIISYVSPPIGIKWKPERFAGGVSLRGQNFGLSSFSARVAIGSTAVVGMHLWWDDTMVWCKVAQGVGHTKPAIVTVQSQVGTGTELVSYMAPKIVKPKPDVDSVWYGDQPLSRPMSFTVRGENMGYASYTAQMRLGQSTCSASDWTSDTTMQCRSVFAGRFAVGANCGLVLTVAEKVGTSTTVFTFAAGKVTGSTSNAPTMGGSLITISGMHGISATQKARIGDTACRATQWQSASSITCAISSGISGIALNAIVTAGRQVYTLQEAVTYDLYVATSFTYDGADLDYIIIEGRNFGAYDATLNRKIGAYGCASSEWISDTAAKCTLLPQVVASDVTLDAVKGMEMCTVCTPPEVLDGCEKGKSPGNCRQCEPCGPGSERQGCMVGGFTRGSCEPCKSGDSFLPEERTFKPDTGLVNTTCKSCLICSAGQYENPPCTATTDTNCTDCRTCEEGSFLVGCAGSSPGQCERLVGVKKIEATVPADLSNSAESIATDDQSAAFKTTKATTWTMTAAYSDVKLAIPAGVLITMSDGAVTPGLTLSVVEVPEELMTAARTMRRGAGGDQYGIIGPVLLLTPSKTRFSPPITMTLPFNVTRVNRTAANQYLAIYKWHEDKRRWIELLGSTEIREGVLAAQTTSFSLYTVISIPWTQTPVDVAATPLIDLKNYGEILTSTELVTRDMVIANAKGPYKKTGIYIPKSTLVTFPVAGETAIFIDFADISLEQANAVSRSKNRKLASDWITTFLPSDVTFAQFVNLTIMYNAQRAEAAQRRASNKLHLAVQKWDRSNRNWKQISGGYVLEAGAMTFAIDTFGSFAVMMVPITPVIFEDPGKIDKSPLQIMTAVPAVIGGTCLVLLCAVVSFAVHRRSRGKKEVERLKSALERRDDEKLAAQSDIDPSVLQLAQQLASKDHDKEIVADQFRAADVEHSDHMDQHLQDQDDLIDPSVLILAQQLAQNDNSPSAGTAYDQSQAASAYGLRSSTLGDEGLSQDEMASLLAGLAAAEVSVCIRHACYEYAGMPMRTPAQTCMTLNV